MGLDVTFYAVKSTECDEVGYFGKVNFILNYFDIDDDDNATDITISKDQFEKFVADLRCELVQHRQHYKCFDEPINPKFRNKEVFFGGSTAYDPSYWKNVLYAYKWANEILNSFNWEECELVINAWW